MRIAIVGYGSEGRANLKYFANRFRNVQFTIFDECERLADAPENVGLVLGGEAFSKIDGNFSLILRSPSVSPRRLAHIRNDEKSFPDGIARCKIWSATNEFFATCPASIIGVTGTKGKGTTCTMIRDILTSAGQIVHLLGNIGIPALEVLPKINRGDIVSFELSSFQLWDLQFSPHIAVVLRIEAEHLDVHDDFDDYVQAKSNIARYQTAADAVIYYAKNKWSRKVAELSAGKKIPYPADINFDTTILHVPGAHYIENATAAIAACRTLMPEISQIAIEKGLNNFRAMPHRLEFVREVGGVKYYDDNFSASWPSLDVAVKAFPGQPIILLAGGFDRGLNNYKDIAESIENSTVRYTILLGQTAPKIAAELTTEHKICSDLSEAISLAHRLAQRGDIVVMSPGTPSFDMWQNFYKRGEEYQKLVKELR